MEQSTYCSLATSAWDDGSKSVCCFADLPRYKNFEEMHRSSQMQSLKQDLANGIKNPICKVCWDTEESGLLSMRQQSLKNEGKQKTVDDIKQEIVENKLKYLNFNTGTKCNFACRTCGPWSSTGHSKEWEARYGEKFETESFNIDDILDQDLSHVKNIEVLGGEPFVNLEHLKIIEKIKNSDPYWLTYTTNGSVRLRQDILDRFKHFKAVNITLSIDAIQKQFEYIRTLGNWNKVEENIRCLIEQKKNYKHLSINCHITISVLNILYLQELLDWCENNNLFFDFTYAYEPAEYSFDILTDHEKDMIRDHLIKDARTMALLSYLDKSSFQQKHRDRFFNSVAFTKKFRNLDINDYLPRLAKLIM